MDNLLEAYKDYYAMWQLYKEFAQPTPKDDKFYEDLAKSAAQIKTTTTLGHLLKIVVLRAISEDDWH